MFKYKHTYSVIIFFGLVLSKTISSHAPDIVEEYIQKELDKDQASKKFKKIFYSAVNVCPSLAKLEEVRMLAYEESDNATKIGLGDDFLDAISRIKSSTSDETIEKIIEQNKDCLLRLSETEQFGLKILFGCMKHSILLHING